MNFEWYVNNVNKITNEWLMINNKQLSIMRNNRGNYNITMNTW